MKRIEIAKHEHQAKRLVLGTRPAIEVSFLLKATISVPLLRKGPFATKR